MNADHHRLLDAMSLGVVVATKDRWTSLRPLLEQLVDQAMEGPVVVVDQSSQQGRDACADWFRDRAPSNFQHVVASPEGLPAARNKGWRLTQVDVVVFVDDDVTIGPGFFSAHLSAYADGTVGAVAGRVTESPSVYNRTQVCNRVEWYGRVLCQLDVEGEADVESVRGANMSFRREALQRSGGFDSGYGGSFFLEETDLCSRLRGMGWRVRYVGAASLVHHRVSVGGCRLTAKRERLRWRCHNTGRYLRRHGGGLSAIGGLAYVFWLSIRSMTTGSAMGSLRTGAHAYWRGWRHGKSIQAT